MGSGAPKGEREDILFSNKVPIKIEIRGGKINMVIRVIFNVHSRVLPFRKSKPNLCLRPHASQKPYLYISCK